jgi:hypothetical protein
MNAPTWLRGPTRSFASILALGLLALGACNSGSSSEPSSAVTLTSIAITPPLPSVAPGFTQDLMATGTYSNATTADLTGAVEWSSSNTATATVSNADGSEGRVTGVGAGSVQITATFPTSGITSSVTLTVSSAALSSIAITPSGSSAPLGVSRQFRAIGTFSDASTLDITQTVSWTSSATNVLVVSNTAGSRGEGACIGVGGSTITASHATTGISGTTAFTVTAAALTGITVTPAGSATALGYTRQFTATGNYSDNTTQDLTSAVTWSSTDVGIATVSNTGGSNGLATSAGVGQCDITASHVASGLAGTTSMQVTPATLLSIAVTPTGQSVVAGYTQQFTATGTFSDNSTQDLTTSVTWSAGSPTIVSISNAGGSQGLATGLAAGSSTIVATGPGTLISGSTSLAVSAAVLESIAITPTNFSRALGYTQQFTAIGTFSDNNTQDLTTAVTWASGTPASATISNAPGTQGLATTVAVGATTISATHAPSGLVDSTPFTVTAVALASIAITPAAPSTALGYSQQFTATGTFSDNSTQNITSTVTWTSSDENIALVSNAGGSKGLGMPVSTGVATVTATDPSTSIAASTTFTITPSVLVSITVTPSNPSAAANGLQAFNALGLYSDNTVVDITSGVTWSSSNQPIATISNAVGAHGLASLLAVGTATITATHTASAISGSTLLTVTPGE